MVCVIRYRASMQPSQQFLPLWSKVQRHDGIRRARSKRTRLGNRRPALVADGGALANQRAATGDLFCSRDNLKFVCMSIRGPATLLGVRLQERRARLGPCSASSKAALVLSRSSRIWAANQIPATSAPIATR